MTSWTTNRQNHQKVELEQLEFEANIEAYLNVLSSYAFNHGNAAQPGQSRKLPKHFPILGPRFVYPTYLEEHLRTPGSLKVDAYRALMAPVNVVHPVYYSRTKTKFRKCPQCGEEDIKKVYWAGWASNGHREVHGLRRPETAMGLQLRCRSCAAAKKKQYCFATTSVDFWEKWKYWEIPRECRNRREQL